jgi:hypothetical protein
MDATGLRPRTELGLQAPRDGPALRDPVRAEPGPPLFALCAKLGRAPAFASFAARPSQRCALSRPLQDLGDRTWGPGPGEARPTPLRSATAFPPSPRCASLQPLRGLRRLRSWGTGTGEARTTPLRSATALRPSPRCASLQPLRGLRRLRSWGTGLGGPVRAEPGLQAPFSGVASLGCRRLSSTSIRWQLVQNSRVSPRISVITSWGRSFI